MSRNWPELIRWIFHTCSNMDRNGQKEGDILAAALIFMIIQNLVCTLAFISHFNLLHNTSRLLNFKRAINSKEQMH